MGVSGDYLWDRTGSDAEVERLEALLRPLALLPPAPVRSFRRARLVVAAAALLVSAALVFSLFQEYDSRSVIEFRLGRFVVKPGSKVKVLHERDDLIKLRLDRGELTASISAHARPELFQVETPATTCVDMGCQYTLTVDADGRSHVVVLTGRVAFRHASRDLYVPAKALCVSRPGVPGTPVWTDAPEPLREAVRAFDEAARPDRPARARVVAALAAEARDSLPLWHFLQDADPAVRAAGLDGLLKDWSPPEGVTRDQVLRGEPAALAAWWNHVSEHWNWHLQGDKK